MASVRSIQLASTENGADKVYHIDIVPEGTGFRVVAFNGRRGGTLARQDKGLHATRAAADAVFDKLVKEKKSGSSHYREIGAAQTEAAVTPEDKRLTPWRPQLANDIDGEAAGELLHGSNWCVQEKYDGKRVMLLVTAHGVTGINRKGETIGIPQWLDDEARLLPDGVFDGELLGEKVVLFDVLRFDGMDVMPQPYHTRYNLLIAPVKTLASKRVELAKTAISRIDCAKFITKLKAANAEGVILRYRYAPYTPGRPAKGGHLLKWKFKASASCVCAGGKRAGKRSVGLVLYDDSGIETIVGNVSVPEGYPLPAPGDIVEVEYLYCFPGGSLFQPVYKGRREDVESFNCTTMQLKYKSEEEDAADQPRKTALF